LWHSNKVTKNKEDVACGIKFFWPFIANICSLPGRFHRQVTPGENSLRGDTPYMPKTFIPLAWPMNMELDLLAEVNKCNFSFCFTQDDQSDYSEVSKTENTFVYSGSFCKLIQILKLGQPTRIP
jgi:hypothetical protein